ncbi:MAG: DNA polymerase III subunit epsilon [Burkholderiales bacterium]|nr:DNA polymerase III subunit epsilon [Burkholderiales bacterium]
MRCLAGAALAQLVWLAFAGGLLGLTLSGAERASLVELIGASWLLLVPALLLGLVLLGGALLRWVWPRVAGPARLTEALLVQAGSSQQRELEAPAGAGAEVAELTAAINVLLAQRTALRADIAAQVAAASRSVELERSQLAALMAELTQSVVVCKLDGRVLLYNNRARLQFRALSSAPTLADGAELLGLGRSIHAVLDRQLIAHALERIQQRLLRGAESPSAQFLTVTRSGQLLRVQMAPVRAVAGASEVAPAPDALAGFVLMLDNVTRDYEQDNLRDQLVHGLTEGQRGSLANLQMAVEMLDEAELDEALRQRFLGVIRDETRAMAERITSSAGQATAGIKTRWPLEEMLGTDLIAAAQRRIEAQTGLRAVVDAVDPGLWLKVDSYSLLLALNYLSARLGDEFETRQVLLRLQAASAVHVHLDLIWAGQALSTETVMSWELDAMRLAEQTSPLSVRDVVERHGGEFWFERERVRHRAFFRFLLPQAAPQEADQATRPKQNDSRPEFYDFDLFQASEQNHALDDRRLIDLAYTVFDTETTGLDPRGGDEIIQIGATRISGGKLRRQESFDQLVDPRRGIPAATIPIHGITPAMVAGKPTLDQVLPAFHAYAQDTVLVAHNAAFDMRFLQLKQASTGVVFDQPVLDTLLLSALIHPNQESHRLEAIAERFDIPVVGRHTALGDALATADVFLRMIPLLQGLGIETLGQARTAAQQSYYARLKY